MKIFLLGFLLALILPSLTFAGTTTLVTYYPAPNGNYKSLAAQNISIGTTDPTFGGAVGSSFTVVNNNNPTAIAAAYSTTQLAFALNPLSNGAWTMYDRVANNGTAWTAGISQASGNVGIGITAPSEELNVKGASAIPAIGSSNAGLARFQESTGGNGIDIGYYYTAGQPPYGWIQSEFTGVVAAYYTLNLNPLGGNVGIGLTVPGEALDVNGNIRFSGGHLITNSGNGALVLNAGPSSLGGVSGVLFRADNTLGNENAFNDLMIVQSSGNVGIGNTSPAHRLDITGLGGGNVDLNVNGQIQTGDANGTGGVWVGPQLFIGQDGSFLGLSNTMGGTTTQWGLTLDNAGDVQVTNNITAYGGIYANSNISAGGPISSTVNGGTTTLGHYSDSQSMYFGLATVLPIYTSSGGDTYVGYDVNGQYYGLDTALPIYTTSGGDTHLGYDVNGQYYGLITNLPIYTSSTVKQGSDQRLKTNIAPITGALDKIERLNGVSFTWKKDGAKDIGVIAQNVEKVLPEIVHVGPDGMKGVEYGNLAALLIEGIKEQQKEIKAQQKEIEKLEKRIDRGGRVK